MIIQNFKLKVGEITILYEYSHPVNAQGCEPFFEFFSRENDVIQSADIINRVEIVDDVSPNESIYPLVASTVYWKMWDCNHTYKIAFYNNKGLLTSRVTTNKQFSINKIEILSSILNNTVFIPSDVHAFLMIGYLSSHEFGLFLHGSMVKFKDTGIVFSGVSGSGKSTISSLVSSVNNSSIIADDRVLVRLKKDIECFSTPYDWKIERCKNIKLPLGCIVFVKHGNCNMIRTLSTEEKIRYLFKTNLLPFYIPDGMAKIVNAFNRIIDCVPIFEYSFLPNKDAANYILSYIEEALSWRCK